MGGFSDDDNWYYKQHLALEWEEVVGPQPKGLTYRPRRPTAFAKIALAPAPREGRRSRHA